MSVKLRILNNYPEWKTKESIIGVAKYLESKDDDDPKFPNDVKTDQEKKRYTKKFDNDDFKVEKRGNTYTVFYQPPLESNIDKYRLRLQVVYPDERDKILKDLYEDRKTGQGIGIRLFYNLVTSKYLNIKRVDVQNFLRKQGDYSITRPYNKSKYNKPVLAKKSNERWGLDLIKMARYSVFANKEDEDKPFQKNLEKMNRGGKMTNILTVIDYFSKKVWARGMESGTSKETAEAFESILRESKTIPRVLHHDDGAEFEKDFQDMIDKINKDQLSKKKHQMKTILTKPYSSTSNGLVERANSMIRSRIRQGFVKNDNLEWFNFLQDYVENINNQRPQGALLTPNQLWTAGYSPQSRPEKRVEGMQNVPIPTDKSSVEELRKIQQRKLIEKGQKQLEKGNPPQVFKVGDFVRVALTNTDMFGEDTGSKMRKRHKKGGLDDPKYSAIKYSPKIYQVSRIIKSKEMKEQQKSAPLGQYWNIGRPKYALVDGDGKKVNNVVTRKKKNQSEIKFYESDLLLVDKDEIPPKIKDLKRINQLNRLEEYEETKEQREKERQQEEELERLRQINRERQEQFRKEREEKESQKKKKEQDRKEDKEIEKELIDIYIDEEMKRAEKEGVKTGRRVSKLANPDAVKRYRKTLVDKIKTIDDLPQDFLDENRQLRDEIRRQDKEEADKEKEERRKEREEDRRSLTTAQRKRATKEKKQEKAKKKETAEERKAEKKRDLDIIEKYIQEEVDKYVKSGKGRKSESAIEGRRQQLEDRIGTNIKNLPSAYVEKQKQATMKGSGLMSIPFLDIFSPL